MGFFFICLTFFRFFLFLLEYKGLVSFRTDRWEIPAYRRQAIQETRGFLVLLGMTKDFMDFTDLMTFDFINRCFPSHCISCNKQGEYLCKTCKKKILPHPEICPLCHRFSADYETCLNCKSEKDWYLEWIIIPFSYSHEMKKLILKLKYYHKKDVLNFLVDRLIIALQVNKKIRSSSIIHPQFSISFVPSHRYRKFFIKWYNQSQLLARKLASNLWLPCRQIVEKIRHTKTQAGLTRQDRLKNLTDVFTLTKTHNLKGNEVVLLVDDVTTTWSTLNQIAKVIKKSYPKVKIWGIVLARHNG